MSRLIGLYPGPWRARYEAELRDLHAGLLFGLGVILLSLLWVHGVAWLFVGGLLLRDGGHRWPTPAPPTGPTEVAA